MGGRRRSQRGAEMLETALIIVPLLGLTFLLVDVSMSIFLRSTFQEAVREGVRYGITGANDTGPCQDDSIKSIVKRYSLGFLNGTASSTMHVHFMSPVTGAVSDNEPGNIIEVTVEGYNFVPWAPFKHSGTARMWARAFDVVEPYPGVPPCLTVHE
jgi:Flp pilus assembly protein TadG